MAAALSIEAEVVASSLFQAVALALATSRPDRQLTPAPETEFAITAPHGEERIVFSSLAEHASPSANQPRARLRSRGQAA